MSCNGGRLCFKVCSASKASLVHMRAMSLKWLAPAGSKPLPPASHIQPREVCSRVSSTRLQRRVGHWADLRYPRRPGASALVLVLCRSRSDDAFGSSSDLRGSEGAVSEELGSLEDVGEDGGVAVGTDQQRSHALRTTRYRLPLVS